MEQDIAFFEQDMQLNYFGTLYTLKVVVPGMTQRKRGRVLFVASVCATIGMDFLCNASDLSASNAVQECRPNIVMCAPATGGAF